MNLLIDNYDSFTFNIYQMIEELGFPCQVVRNDEISCDEIEKLNPSSIIISPGPGRPSEAGLILEVIRRFSGKIPILGICLGHQAIGEAFGGSVVRARRPHHGKLSLVHHSGHGMFRGLEKSFKVTRYHSLVIERKSLPACLEVTAQTKDGLIMGVRHREFNVEGVQFHPESFATEHGRDLITNFLEKVA